MRNKNLKLTKDLLENLYWNKSLSLKQIGERLGCQGTNVLYWLKKFNIKRRPAYRKKVDIPKKTLEDLYLKKKMSSREIAEKLGNVNARTIRKKLNKFGIPTRSVSEALTRKFKMPFDNNLHRKAYFLGLRAGDFYAKWARKSVRIQTSTTHLAQINLLEKSFEDYGEIRVYLMKMKNKLREDEWFIYIDLHSSFDFLVSKPKKIPDWIMKNEEYFFQFLVAYMDCEGSWKVLKSHQKHVRFIFKLRTGDLKILKQLKNGLERLNYHPYLYLDKKKGTRANYGIFNQDMFDLSVNRKKEIISLAKKLLPLSKHSEKIRKMNFILNNKHQSWNGVQNKWASLRAEIKTELLKNQVLY